eukprot:934650-Pyramimonas_sp.AAC.1
MKEQLQKLELMCQSIQENVCMLMCDQPQQTTIAAPARVDDKEVLDESSSAPCVEDLVTGTLTDDPWQFRPYDKASSTWQAAAQRRHQHRRRTNTLIGTAS